jgi:hypothetical protein
MTMADTKIKNLPSAWCCQNKIKIKSKLRADPGDISVE